MSGTQSYRGETKTSDPALLIRAEQKRNLVIARSASAMSMRTQRRSGQKKKTSGQDSSIFTLRSFKAFSRGSHRAWDEDDNLNRVAGGAPRDELNASPRLAMRLCEEERPLSASPWTPVGAEINGARMSMPTSVTPTSVTTTTTPMIS